VKPAYYVAARVDRSAPNRPLSATTPHNHARHIYVDMWRATYPFNGALYAFRGRRGNLLKLMWHDGIGLCMLTKRLERGHFIWPMTSTGSVALSTGQLSTLLEGCEWRATARNLRPELAG
jgi:transposase